MVFFKRQFPIIIAVLLGVMLVGQYYVPSEASNAFLKKTSVWYRIISAMAIILGLHSLISVHTTKIKRKVKGWGYSLVVFTGLSVTVFFGLIHEVQEFFNFVFSAKMDFTSSMGSWTHANPQGSSFQWIYKYIYVSCAATMFSILAFYIASAAYRTFRARNLEAAVLLGAALIVMLGRVPIGEMIIDALPNWADWLMTVPNMAAKRGILIGVCLGGVATALRIILGIEKSYLGGSSEE